MKAPSKITHELIEEDIAQDAGDCVTYGSGPTGGMGKLGYDSPEQPAIPTVAPVGG